MAKSKKTAKLSPTAKKMHSSASWRAMETQQLDLDKKVKDLERSLSEPQQLVDDATLLSHCHQFGQIHFECKTAAQKAVVIDYIQAKLGVGKDRMDRIRPVFLSPVVHGMLKQAEVQTVEDIHEAFKARELFSLKAITKFHKPEQTQAVKIANNKKRYKALRLVAWQKLVDELNTVITNSGLVASDNMIAATAATIALTHQLKKREEQLINKQLREAKKANVAA